MCGKIALTNMDPQTKTFATLADKILSALPTLPAPRMHLDECSWLNLSWRHGDNLETFLITVAPDGRVDWCWYVGLDTEGPMPSEISQTLPQRALDIPKSFSFTT